MAKQRRKTEDRVVNISTSELGQQQLIRYYGGTAQIAYAPQASIIKRVVHIRSPAGGKAVPEREKPFTHARFTFTAPSGRVRIVSGDYWYEWTGHISADINGFPGTLRPRCGFPHNTGAQVPFQENQYPPSTSVDLRSQAEVKALNKLDDESGAVDFDLGVFYGERKETIELFRNGAVGLLKLVRSLKRGDFASAADVLMRDFRLNGLGRREMKQWKRSVRSGAGDAKSLFDTLSSTVLMWNLGISPLLRDIDALQQRIVNGDLLSRMAVKAKGKHYRINNYKESQTVNGGRIEIQTEVSELVGYTVTLVAVPHQTVLADLSRLGLTNLPALAWELTTASFIVDYFWAFGPWLSSLKVPERFVWQDGSYTHRVRRITTQRFIGAPSDVSLTPAEAVLDYTKRTVYTTWPTPVPPLSLKGSDLKDKQAINTGLVAMQKVRALLGLR